MHWQNMFSQIRAREFVVTVPSWIFTSQVPITLTGELLTLRARHECSVWMMKPLDRANDASMMV